MNQKSMIMIVMIMIIMIIIMMTKGKEGVPKSPMALSMKLPWKSKNFKAKSKVSLIMMMMMMMMRRRRSMMKRMMRITKVGSKERQHGIEKKVKSAPVPVRDMVKYNQKRLDLRHYIWVSFCRTGTMSDIF